jgi:hypothetical protein
VVYGLSPFQQEVGAPGDVEESCDVAAGLGLEPRLPGPEPGGLPLPHPAFGPAYQGVCSSTGNESNPGGTFESNDATTRSKSARSSSQPPGGKIAAIR